jgi:hypothetical protein
MSRKKRKKITPQAETVAVKPEETKKMDILELLSLVWLFVDPRNIPALIDRLRKRGSLGLSYQVVILAQGIQTLGILISYLIGFFIGQVSISILYLIIQIVSSALFSMLLFYLFAWLLYRLAKAFGGDTDFAEQAYTYGMLYLLFSIATFPLTVILPFLSLEPLVIIGILLALAIVALTIYFWTYIAFQIVKKFNGFSTLKSVGITVGAIVLTIILLSLTLTIVASLLGTTPTA